MLFSSDPSKPVQEVLFSRKKTNPKSYDHLSVNNVHVERSSYQKHLAIILDEKLNFNKHIDSAISKVNKGISVIKKLRHISLWTSLVTNYEALLRPLLDHGDIFMTNLIMCLS